MIDQITDSIGWDCDYKIDPPVKMTPKKWLSIKKDITKKSIAYHKKAHAEEVKRCKDRTLWIQALIKSFKYY